MATDPQHLDIDAPIVELELTDMAHGGDAVGRYEGRAVFVTGGLAGELVRAQLTRERSNYARAVLVEVLRPAPDRVTPRYPELGESGGFQWQHLSYPAQLAWKTRITRQLLMRVGHFAHPTVHPMLGMPAGSDPWRYRTVAQFAVDEGGAIGFRRAGSHQVIDMAECPIVHPALDQLYQAVRGWLRERWGSEVAQYVERFTLRVAANDLTSPGARLLPPGIPALATPPTLPDVGRPPDAPTDAARGGGQTTVGGVGQTTERGGGRPPDAATSQAGRDQAQRAGVVGLEVRTGGAFDAAGGPEVIGRALLEAVPALVGVVALGLPGGRGRVAIGQDYIYDRVYDRVFRISAGSFFQVNAAQTPVLVERVLTAARLRPTEQVLDGYSGVGLFSLFFAGRAARVTAIESQASAVADARASAEINHITNVNTLEGVLERSLGTLTRQGERFDLALVDPPRSGCHPRALSEIRALGPRALLYVSCDPSTMARDLHLLCDEHLGSGSYRARGGADDAYQLVSVQPVDLFPHTAHIECIALVERG
ncbi:MAG TPA: class I SAM-dependent RNA methyltransferase [Ktedonobacterales bacterium]|nr:class I SAM-dependent RNA methyltransferase [Ktedonobacterales bacterium]